MISVPLKRFANGQGLPRPAYQSEGAAGFDLHAAIEAGAVLVLAPGARELVPTGIALQIPPGFEGQVRPRSGLAARFGVTVLNAPGTIDADYRGEIRVLLVNLGQVPFEIRRGERIAQMIIAPVTRVALIGVEDLSESVRGAGGFGSTGRDSGA